MTVMTLKPSARVRNRVAAGAQFLDKTIPGWERNINVKTLDVATLDRCVLGQLFGGYEKGLNRLRLNGNKVAEGFGFYDTAIFTFWFGGYAALTRAWKDLVRERLSA